MEERTLLALIGLAAVVGFVHTLVGPDHYVPFIALSKAGRWSLARTLAVTLACGIGHVLSSVLLGGLGILLGLAVERLEYFESVRGGLAGWLFVGFGLAYMVWGIRRGLRGKRHTHLHVHEDGTMHDHPHDHHGEHVHVHSRAGAVRSMTPWVLFTIFIFGPCEPLIPILFYPAAEKSVFAVVAVTIAFAVATLAAMTGMVALGYFGLGWLSSSRLERYSHAGAGFAITACGLAIKCGL